MTVGYAPVSDRWISLVLIAYSEVANRPQAVVRKSVKNAESYLATPYVDFI